jgi:L-ascorbate metabolism protein UlaG (beta-lactamase superfamily)
MSFLPWRGERRESPMRPTVTVLLLFSTLALAAGGILPLQVPRERGFSTEMIPHPAFAQEAPTPLTVWYLGHCGYAVRTGTKLLVFDYLSERGTPAADPRAGGLDDGIIEPADLDGHQVYVFVTHSHSDHWDPRILEWEPEVEDIEYVFGWAAGADPRHHYLVGPRATATLDDLEIYTINSHHSGVPEVAYLVHVDGHWVYHNGDYRQDYLPDFEYLGTLTHHMDLVFHVGLTDEQWQYTRQGYYLMEHFHPDAFFTMHFGGNEEEMADFPPVMADRGYDTNILVPGRRGDRWEIGG